MLSVFGDSEAHNVRRRSPPRTARSEAVGAILPMSIGNCAVDLVGRNLSVVDATLGPRQETLEDARRRGRWMVVYPVAGDLLGTARYVVETRYGTIQAISKAIQNIDGAEDVFRET